MNELVQKIRTGLSRDLEQAIQEQFLPTGLATLVLLMEMIEQLEQLKTQRVLDDDETQEHLPGKHDQMTHGSWSAGSSFHDPSKHIKGAAKSAKQAGGGKSKSTGDTGRSSFDASHFSAMSDYARHEAKSKEYDAQISKLSLKDHDALITYTSNAYQDLNYRLRTEGELSTSQKTLAKNLDHALESTKTTEDMILTRGMGNSPAVYEQQEALEKGMQSGGIFREKAYCSTSINSNPPFSGLKATIRYPKGSPGIYIGDHSDFPAEREFLLPRGSAFKILSYDKSKNTVELEYIPQAQAGKLKKAA